MKTIDGDKLLDILDGIDGTDTTGKTYQDAINDVIGLVNVMAEKNKGHREEERCD